MNANTTTDSASVPMSIHMLVDLTTGEDIRRATLAEERESRRAEAEEIGHNGAIEVDGRLCFVS
jgi:hypothetical protein